MKIKICGLRESQNIYDIALLGPDYMGFIFYARSKRFAADFMQPSDLRIIGHNTGKTGVFVNEDVVVIERIAKHYDFTTLQLHGNEQPNDCGYLKQQGYSVIKAFPVSETTDFLLQKRYEKVCDYFLFDTMTSGFGGSGRSFDWQVLQRYDLAMPFFLSGGLVLHNIEEVMQFSHPMLYGLDFNSRLETEPGIKDNELVRNIINKIKSHERIQSR